MVPTTSYQFTHTCELTPMLMLTHKHTFLIKQVDANISPVIIARTFLPVIDIVILPINTIKQNIVFNKKNASEK